MERTCRTCERTLPDAEFYTKGRYCCKDCAKKRIYARRDNIKAQGLCIMCRSPSVESGTTCLVCKKKALQRYYDNQPEYRATAKARRRQLKADALAAYGGAVCVCCGEKHIEFLAIDHINGDGAEHRRALLKERGWKVSATAMSGSHMYYWLRENNYPPGFQVLCANCNTAKGHAADRLCPHERERLATSSLPAAGVNYCVFSGIRRIGEKYCVKP